MLGCGPSLYALRSPALTLQANAQALERVLAAAGSPAPLGPAGTGAADTPGACAAVPRRARRAGGALALVSGAGHDALALADLTKVPRSAAPRPPYARAPSRPGRARLALTPDRSQSA